jgi:redox-sensitive bicupin YhaK (pirin superfamily)
VECFVGASRSEAPKGGVVIETRREKEIHHEDGGWFDARWHFSFGGYRDPEQMGVGALRVFNDDRIVAGADWPMHPHRDIESLTYVVDGHFLHADSLGNNGRLEAGAAQVMSFSGGGDQHSERNGSETEPMRFIQFWILPSNPLTTSVQQHQYQLAERTTAGCRSWGRQPRTGSISPRTRGRSSAAFRPNQRSSTSGRRVGAVTSTSSTER